MRLDAPETKREVYCSILSSFLQLVYLLNRKACALGYQPDLSMLSNTGRGVNAWRSRILSQTVEETIEKLRQSWTFPEEVYMD